MRKELFDLIHEAMDQHELARDFYHRMAHQVAHADTRKMFEYLAQEAEENKARLHQCLTPEGCPVVPPVHEAHLAEHLQVPQVTIGMLPKEAVVLAIKRSEGLCRFYQSLVELQPEGEIRRRLEYLARAESGHKEKLEEIYDMVAFPEVRKSPMRKELVDLIHEAMDQHELARDFYHRMAHRVAHADTRKMFEYLAQEAEENKAKLHHCLTPEGCPVVPPGHDVHLAEHLQVPEVTEGMLPKEALAVAIKRSEGLCRFYQSLLELQPEGEIRRRLEYLARAESSHKEKLENLYDTVAFPEAW